MSLSYMVSLWIISGYETSGCQFRVQTNPQGHFSAKAFIIIGSSSSSYCYGKFKFHLETYLIDLPTQTEVPPHFIFNRCPTQFQMESTKRCFLRHCISGNGTIEDISHHMLYCFILENLSNGHLLQLLKDHKHCSVQQKLDHMLANEEKIVGIFALPAMKKWQHDFISCAMDCNPDTCC